MKKLHLMNKPAYSIIGLAIAASLSVTSAYANTNDNEEVLTVTGTRSPINIDTALASTVIITQEDIARTQAKSLSDILAIVAGIDISNQGGKGQNESLFVRGTNSDHTLVLIDGVRVSSASLGSTNTQLIAPELIERIEIVKGPRAAIWGSDALGGVIQIFTRKLSGNELFVGATFGSDNYHQLKAGAGISHGDGYTSITVNSEKSDGFDVLNAGEDDDDGFKHQALAIRGQQQINGALSLDWMARVDFGESEYDNAFGGADENENRNYAWLVRSTYQTLIGHVQNYTSVSIGKNRDYSKDFEKGTDDNTTFFETKRNQFSLLNHSQVFPHLQFNLGVDYYQEELTSTTTFAQDERDVTGIFAHTLYNKNAITGELAIRYDDVEGVGSETSYNLGAGYQFNRDTRIALNMGTGFKAPSFNDLYFPSSPFASGNDALIAETSETIELVLESRIAVVDFAFNAYVSNVDNLIVWLPDENFFFKPENINKVDIGGLEFSAKYQGLGGQHQLSASYVESEDKATGEQLIRRAKDQLSYQFDTNIGDLAVYIEYQYNGKRYDRDFTLGRVALDSYHLVNLAASYPITDNLQLETRITNAFDEKYHTVLNYNTQERAGYLGISYAL